jgi:hypothetical protein
MKNKHDACDEQMQRLTEKVHQLKVDQKQLLTSLLYSFCDGGQYKEQDFIQALIEFIPGESDYQKLAIEYLQKAIHALDCDDIR